MLFASLFIQLKIRLKPTCIKSQKIMKLIKCVNMTVHVCLYLLIYISCSFSFFQSTESKSFVMGLFKGKLNVQQVFPYPEGMYLNIFFYPLSSYGCTCIIKSEDFFFLNTCTKAGQMQFVNVKTFCFLCHCYITWQLFMLSLSI